jgi:Tfp pilus assembly protein PilF
MDVSDPAQSLRPWRPRQGCGSKCLEISDRLDFSRPMSLAFRWTLSLALAAGSGTAPDAGEAREEAVQAHLRTGNEHLRRREAAQAAAAFRSALALDPHSAEGHLLLAQAYLAARSAALVAEAKAELQQALDLDPDLFWARFYVARIYSDQGRLDRARQELERGLTTRPNAPHLLSALGEVHRRLGDPEQAIRLQRQAEQLDSSLPTRYYLGLAYLDLGRPGEAQRELEEAVKSTYVSPDMYVALASLYAKAERGPEAEELCRKAIALDPSRPEARLSLARLLNGRGASDAALEELARAMPRGASFPPSAHSQQLQADVFFERGRAYQAKEMIAEALRESFLGLEVKDEGRTHVLLAELYLARGDHARALEHVARAEALGSRVDSLRAEIARRARGGGPGGA